jgi:hypothetical protein
MLDSNELFWQQTGNKEKATYRMNCKWLITKWAQLGSNQRPPDYESPFFDILSASKKSGYLIYLTCLGHMTTGCDNMLIKSILRRY